MGACDGMVHIRRARESDALGMADVHVRTWREAYRDSLPPDLLAALDVEARANFWREELRTVAPERSPWVAEATDHIVGFVAAGGARDETAQPSTGEVYAIYVLPECWDRGVGWTLLAHAEHDLLDHGYDEAVLWVLADNQRARTFYELAGWRADGGVKHQNIGGHEVEEVRYRLKLETSNVAGLI